MNGLRRGGLEARFGLRQGAPRIFFWNLTGRIVILPDSGTSRRCGEVHLGGSPSGHAEGGDGLFVRKPPAVSKSNQERSYK